MTTSPNRPELVPRGYFFRYGPDSPWNFQVTLGGRTYRRSTCVRDQVVAREVLELFIEDTVLTHPDFPPPAPIRWQELVPIWVRHAKFRVSPWHIANVRLLAERHCLIIQDVLVHLLDQNQVDRVIAAYRARSASKGRVEAMVRVLRLLLAWAEERRFRGPDSPTIVFPNLEEEAAKRRAEREEQQQAASRRGRSEQPSSKPQEAPALVYSAPPPRSARSEPQQPPPTSVHKRGGLWFPDHEVPFGIPQNRKLKTED